jgi:hypothetical protein
MSEDLGELDLPVEFGYFAAKMSPGSYPSAEGVDLAARPLFLLAVSLREIGLEPFEARDLIVPRYIQLEPAGGFGPGEAVADLYLRTEVRLRRASKAY